MTTEQKIEVLEKDILQRTGRYFTSARTNGRLGQEDASASGAVYSAAMLSPKDSADLHRMAYGHARDMIVAMNTPFRVRIALTPDVSCTDGRVVSVATDMFDNPDLSAAQKIDIFTGLAVHEGSHLLYTDFNMMSRSGNRVVADLFNIIEDERIEMLTGEDRPGLAGFLGCAKYYYFDRHSARMRGRSGSIGLSRPARLMNSILAMVRYPEALDMDDTRDFADTLYERIYELIKAFFEKENKSDRNPQQNGKAGSSLDSEVEKALEKVLESLEKDVIQVPSDGKIPSHLDDSRMSAEIMKDGNRLGRVLEGELEMGSTDRVNIHRPDADRSRYEESLSRVRRFVPTMATALRGNGTDRSLDLRGLRSGRLDTCKLAEAVQGVENIYRQERTVRADRMAVCVLVDESGSMEGEKIEAARDTAVLLNEAISGIRNVDLYIYGHTTENGQFVKLNAYREGKAPKDKHVLGSIDADWSNIDSKAIREAASRVRARTREKCLFFVVSDGAPCEPVENVRKAVKELSRDGFSFVSIGIDFEYDPSAMYDHHVSMTDMSRLAPELGKMIKKAIMDNSKRQWK